ncbi:MAG: ribbon-helix-helix protein, CopG family [Opitutaceae bacterium]|jgi:hypothetical protein
MASTTLRLSPQEKRRFTVEARRRGQTLSRFLREAAHKEVRLQKNPWRTFFAENPPVKMEGPSNLSTREGFGR